MSLKLLMTTLYCAINLLTFHRLFVTYLQEFINFHLSVLVEVHLVKDFMERIFINVDIDALQRRKTRSGINSAQ